MNNNDVYNVERIKELLRSADTIAIMPSEVSGPDSYSAAAGLYHSLISSDKNATFIYKGETPAECKGLIDPDQIAKDIYSRKMEISIDYTGTPASKLAYSNEGTVLKLVLSPVSRDFDRSRIKTDIKGYDFDLIFALGAQRSDDFMNKDRDLKDEFTKARVVNLDNTDMNNRFGDINIIDTKASNLSEIVFKLLSYILMVPNGRAAKALLVGMSYREPRA